MSHLFLKAAARLTMLACTTIIFIATAQAADNFRYVSNSGKNANPCSLAQPCRSLQRGISLTPPGGELRILDSGFYGNNATISKTMTISGSGNTITLGAPITISHPNATVVLRGLVLSGDGNTTLGVDVTAARAVQIERCVISGFTAEGVNVSTSNIAFFFTDSVSRNNGGIGIYFIGSANAKVTVDNSRVENNAGHGLYVQGNTDAVIINSVISKNGGTGLTVYQGRMSVSRTTAANNNIGFNAAGHLTLDSSTALGNAWGLLASGLSTVVRISNSVFVNNNVGIENVNATALTRGNNTVSGNTANVQGTWTALGGI